MNIGRGFIRRIDQVRPGATGLVNAGVGAAIDHSNLASAIKAMPSKYHNIVDENGSVCLTAQTTPPKPDIIIICGITNVLGLLKCLRVPTDFTRALNTLLLRRDLPFAEIESCDISQNDVSQNQCDLDCCRLRGKQE